MSLDNFDIDLNYIVESFSFQLLRPNANQKNPISNIQSNLNQSILDELKNVKNGDTLKFDKIMIKLLDNTSIEIEPVNILVTN